MKVFKDIFIIVLILLTVITSLAAVNSLSSRACNFSLDNVTQGGNPELQGTKGIQESVDSRFEALERWYESTHHSSSTFMVGFYPYGVAFDGANICVTNSGSVSVTKLRASDGMVIGTYAVGFAPRGVAFDGAVLGTYNVGLNPRGVVFDGANIWVVNYDSG